MAVSSTSFKKGQVANPTGRPPLTPERFEFKQAMERLLPIAWQRLDEMLASDDFEKHKFAIPIVFDRTQGRAIERKEVTGAAGGAIQIEDSTPAIRLLLQAVIADETKVIEAKADEPDA
jgi:hypothetical protein